MTEIKPQSPAMQLAAAARLAGFFSVADGWPPAFTASEIATLQYPDDTARRADLASLLDAAIKSGEIATVEAQRLALFQDLSKPIQYWPDAGIERDPAARALREIAQVEPSECLRVWLGPAWKGEAPKVRDGDTAPIEKRTRAALIKELKSDWPTIERDLQDAARNGLADAAKLSGGRGWDKRAALEWARERGKLKANCEGTAPAPWYATSVIRSPRPASRRK